MLRYIFYFLGCKTSDKSEPLKFWIFELINYLINMPPVTMTSSRRQKPRGLPSFSVEISKNWYSVIATGMD